MSLNINGVNGLENQLLYGKMPVNTNGTEAESTIFDGELSSTENTAEMDKAIEEYTEAAAAVGKTTDSSKVEDKTLDEIEEEIEELKEEREEIEGKMEDVEAEIEELAESAETNIKEALTSQENSVEEYNEESEKALKDNVNAYIEANKEGGEGMTRDELQENIKNSLPNQPGMADAMAKLVAASQEINQIDSLLGDLNQLITEAKSLDDQIDAKQTEYEEAEEAAKQKTSCCDPIGFTMGEGEDAAQYDFIVDDGAFDSTSDFLGAQNQFGEMAALDTDGDNIVTSAELKAGNIKAVKTDANGQEVVDIAEEFGEDFSIDLNSFRTGGSHSAVDTNADADGNGIKDQTLLGTFNVNVNGQTVQGYDTLDDNEYLTSKYNVSSATENGLGTAAAEEGNAEYEDLQSHTNFFNLYTEKSAQLKEELTSAYEQLGLTDEEIEGINEATKIEAQEEVQSFYASLATEDQEKIDETEKGETEINTEEEEEKEEKIQEELAA